jgi:hypothetical protein
MEVRAFLRRSGRIVSMWKKEGITSRVRGRCGQAKCGAADLQRVESDGGNSTDIAIRDAIPRQFFMAKNPRGFCTTSAACEGSQVQVSFIPNPNPIMKTHIKSLLVALSAFALCGTATARAAQPEMNGAIVQLEEAKHARHPIEHLERAKHELEEARHNKGGERVEAIRQVNEAIEAARHDNHRAMHEHIDAAIHEVREGKHDARKR